MTVVMVYFFAFTFGLIGGLFSWYQKLSNVWRLMDNPDLSGQYQIKRLLQNKFYLRLVLINLVILGFLGGCAGLGALVFNEGLINGPHFSWAIATAFGYSPSLFVRLGKRFLDPRAGPRHTEESEALRQDPVQGTVECARSSSLNQDKSLLRYSIKFLAL